MKKVKLGEVVTLKKGKKATILNEQTTISQRYIQIDDLRNDNNLKFTESLNMTEALLDDILIAWDGANAGTIGYGLSGAVGSTIMVLKKNEQYKDKIISDYLGVFLESKSQYLRYHSTGATIPHLNKNILLDLKLELLRIEEQENIICILNIIKRLITKRKCQLEELNLLVKSRFNEMFGDISKFDVERLNNSVKEMFIGPFGSSLKNDYFVSKEKAYCMVYEQKHAIKKTMNLETRYVDEKKYKELKRFSIYGGDIIVSCRGTIGEIFQVPNNAPLGIMHPSIMKIRLDNSKYNPIFFKFMLSDYMDIEKIKSKGSGVKMAITASELGKIGFPLPPLSLQNEFADFVAQVDKSQLAIQKSLEELETLKKSLMQEYFG